MTIIYVYIIHSVIMGTGFHNNLINQTIAIALSITIEEHWSILLNTSYISKYLLITCVMLKFKTRAQLYMQSKVFISE